MKKHEYAQRMGLCEEALDNWAEVDGTPEYNGGLTMSQTWEVTLIIKSDSNPYEHDWSQLPDGYELVACRTHKARTVCSCALCHRDIHDGEPMTSDDNAEHIICVDCGE